jgi:pimeloyl-ACP methyl ester carboxylesterase
MGLVWVILGWILAILFGLLTVSMLLLQNWGAAIVTLLLVLLFFPPLTSTLQNSLGFSIHPLLRGILIVGFLALFAWLLVGRQVTSIYASPEVKARFMAIYDKKMGEWPVPYEDLFLDTEYGTVHVIASGPQDAPPLLLLHASGVSGWSWKYNAAGLSENYRTYAIDLIGDAGKSEYTSLEQIMKNGRDQARLYTEITDKLGVDKAFVAGASEGGFIGSNYALYAPERVEKLVLLGPMGYAGATQSIRRIMFAQFFPLKPIQESTFRWAFSDSDVLEEDLGEWFRLLMSKSTPKKVAPLPLPAEERQRIQVPVLFVFGEKDNLVGDPQAASDLVQDMPDAQVKIVEAGHLMAAELPEQVNEIMLEFFEGE